MKFGKITATVFMAIAAVGVTAGTAYADPAGTVQQPAAHNDATSGVDNGIHYQTTVSPISKAVTATVDGGRFVIAPDASSVALETGAGQTVDRVSLRPEISGHVFTVGQQISSDGRSLTLTPTVSGQDIGQVKDISSFDNMMAEVNKNIVGVAIGGILGAFLGSLIGFGIFSIITAPLGGLLGAVAGGYAVGGQEFLNSVQAVATGQP